MTARKNLFAHAITLLLLTGTLSLLTGAARAQVTFTGVIHRLPAPSACQETHFLTCTGHEPGGQMGVRLASSTLDLNAHTGVVTTFTAVRTGGPCNVLDVIDARSPVGTLTMCGSTFPGCTLRFRVGPSGVLGRWSLFLSDAPEFFPIDTTIGTLLVRRPFLKTASGFTFGPTETFDIRIPAGPSTTGMSFWIQGLRQDIGPIGRPMLTNSVCFTVGPPGPPCVQPGC